jgi:hypothetical protein
MNNYRLYFLDEAGRVFKGQDCDAVDDLTALEIAISLSKDHAIEIWQSTRRVAKLQRGGDAAPYEEPVLHRRRGAQ